MSRRVRRVVTTVGPDGKSRILSDGPAPHVYQRSQGAATVHELWSTSATPADVTGDEDPTLGPFRLPPPSNGSVFRLISYPPDKERLGSLHREHASDDDGSGRGQALDRSNKRHPGFHKTNSIDYAIVVEGEIYALLDEGEVLLKAGDTLVQRGTSHAWSNRSALQCLVAFILIDAVPTP